jgi:hypothetical protein
MKKTASAATMRKTNKRTIRLGVDRDVCVGKVMFRPSCFFLFLPANNERA